MKRGLPFLCVCLVMLCVGARAEGDIFAAQTESGTVLCDKTGKITCAAGTYDVLYDLDIEKGLFCAQPYDDTYLTCIVDANGNALCDAIYEDIYLQNGVLYARRDGLLGVLGEDYSEAIACKYAEITSTGEGPCLAIAADPYDGKADGVYLVDENAQQKVTGSRVLFGLNTFSEGLMPAMSADTSCYGYLNTQGEWAIAAQYDYAGEFHKGCAEAALESGLGLIDKEGNWLLTPRYISLYSNTGESTLVVAQEDTESAVLIDCATMEKVKTFTGDSVWFTAGFDTDVVVISLPEETLLVNGSGETLLTAQPGEYFLACAEMGECVIRHSGSWGEYGTVLMTLGGETRTQAYQDMDYCATFDGIRLFTVTRFETESEESDDGTWLSEVPETTRYGVIDENGNEVLPMDSYYIQSVCDGMLMLTSDTHCCLFDLRENRRIEIQ